MGSYKELQADLLSDPAWIIACWSVVRVRCWFISLHLLGVQVVSCCPFRLAPMCASFHRLDDGGDDDDDSLYRAQHMVLGPSPSFQL